MEPGTRGQSAGKIDFDAIRHNCQLPTIAAEYVELRRAGREYEALCPFHDDRNPSLTIYPSRDGVWRYMCFACGERGDVIDWISKLEHVDTGEAARRLSGDDLRPERIERPSIAPPPADWLPMLPIDPTVELPIEGGRWRVWNLKPKPGAPDGRWTVLRPSAFWRYTDAQARTLGYVLRCDFPDGGKWTPTVTWCRHRETGEARWCLVPFPRPRPLLALDQLSARPRDPVLWVEGEKSAIAGARLLPGFVVTTTPGGTNGIAHADLAPLAGRPVTLWPDADAPGRQAAQALGARLAAQGCAVRLIDTAGQPDGWDVADAATMGWTTAQAVAWAKPRLRSFEAPAGERQGWAASGARSGESDTDRPPAGEADDTASGPSAGPSAGPSTGPSTAPSTAPTGPPPDLEPADEPSPVDGAATEFIPAEARAPAADLDTAAEDADALPAMYAEDNVALAFSRQYAEDLRYVAAWGRWMHWTGQRWSPDETLLASELSRRICRAVADYARRDTTLAPRTIDAVTTRYGLAGTISAVERLARTDRRHAATVDQWDADLWALNTPGGVVDLRTGELRPPRRDDHCTKLTRTAPSPAGARAPIWLRFLDEATAGDTALVAFLQRMAGYALTGSVRDHALFFVYGTGANGKGTFLNTLTHILGDYAQPASMEVFTESRNDRHPTELASLRGARLVSAQETEEGKRWAESRIKQLTGGDPIRARYMRQDEFTFTPQFKLVIAGNHKPGLRNVDEAIRRRLHLIPFTVTIPVARRDATLPDRLLAEAPAILRWAIDGCLAWQRTGLSAPKSVLAATAEYLEQQDILAAWLFDCCELGDAFTSRSADLYRSYKSWAERAGEFALPQKRWVAAMETHGLSSRKSGTMVYDGLRLKPDDADRWERVP